MWGESKNVNTNLLLFLLQLFSKCSLHKTQTTAPPNHHHHPSIRAMLPHKESEQGKMTWGGGWPGVGGSEKAAAPGPLGWALPVLPSAVWAARLGVWGHGWRQQRPGDEKTKNDETPLPQSCSANFVSERWFLSAVKVFQALLDEILCYQQADARSHIYSRHGNCSASS